MGRYVLKSLFRLGELSRARNKNKAAKKYFNEVINQYALRGFKPASPESEHAAQARFELVDYRFREYQKLQLKGSLPQMGRILQKAKAMLEELISEYSEVTPYGALDWTFAAFFRIGQLHQDFAQKLYDAPEPRGLSEDDMDAYRTQLEDEGTRWEDAAVAKYEEMIQQAR